MIGINSLVKHSKQLICFFMFTALVLLSASAATAQHHHNGYSHQSQFRATAKNQSTNSVDYCLNVKVLSISGSLIQCSDGFSVDVSTADNDRKIEVGDLLSAYGQLISNSSGTSLIKATSTSVLNPNDVEFDGFAQSVSATSLKVLNQQVQITSKTKIQNGPLVAGKAVIAETEYLNNAFVANRIIVVSDDSNNDGISTTITKIEGNRVQFTGGFSTVATKENLQFLVNNQALVGSFVFVNLKTLPNGKKLKTPFLGFVDTNLSFGGTLQSLDATNTTITVVNHPVQLNNNTEILDFHLNRLTFSDLKADGTELVSVQMANTNKGPVVVAVFVYTLADLQ